ncbi:MAG: choice-of-anchor Q domain-containing protein [Actinomycetota bacterium]
MQNVTISDGAASGAGGGIEVMNDGSATAFVLDNTIVANNGANECIVSGVVATSSGVVSSGGNLITANDGCPGVVETANPQLGPLQPNAPGDTPTMAIQYGISPAVDAGDDATALATDQRGVPRPQGAHSDIGAYEAPPPSADLSLTKEVSSSTAQPGDTVTYTLTVKNSGPNTANTVTVTDDLPSELTFVSCSASGGGSCSYSGSGITATYGSLAVDETETVAVQTTLNAGTQDNVTVVNTASVSASSPTDPDTSNNSSSASFTVHNRADLAVIKQVSATQVEVGDPVTYTLTLTNNGPYDAKSVVLSDPHPAGVTFSSCSSTVGTCSVSGGNAGLSLGSLTNGSSVTVTVNATLDFGVADGSTVTNTALVTSTTFDPDGSNNSSSVSFTVLNNSDLFVSQSVTKLKNRQLKYTVNVKNLGKYPGKLLLLTDAVPSGAKFVSISAGAWTCSAPPAGSTGTISCTLNSLAVNATQSLTFIVKVTTPGNTLVGNTATISAATFDPNTANNSATLTAKVGP